MNTTAGGGCMRCQVEASKVLDAIIKRVPGPVRHPHHPKVRIHHAGVSLSPPADSALGAAIDKPLSKNLAARDAATDSICVSWTIP